MFLLTLLLTFPLFFLDFHAIGATVQACRQAGIDIETDEPADGIDRSRLGIYLGAGEGSVDNNVFFEALVKAWNVENSEMDWGKWAEVAFGKMAPMRELEQEPNMTAAQVIGILRRTAAPLPGHSFDWRNESGFGAIDVAASLREARLAGRMHELKKDSR